LLNLYESDYVILVCLILLSLLAVYVGFIFFDFFNSLSFYYFSDSIFLNLNNIENKYFLEHLNLNKLNIFFFMSLGFIFGYFFDDYLQNNYSNLDSFYNSIFLFNKKLLFDNIYYYYC